MKSSVCLICIVRNHRLTIEASLLSCVDFIDHAVVCNLNSHDRSLRILTSTLGMWDIPFTLTSYPFEFDFGGCRNQCLLEVPYGTTHILMMEMDEMLFINDYDFKNRIPDVCLVRSRNSESMKDNYHPTLFKYHPAIHYQGEVFEVPKFPDSFDEAEIVREIEFEKINVGEMVGGEDEVFEDLLYQKSLEMCLRGDPYPSFPGRRAFYLAISAMKTGRGELAKHWFKKRSEMKILDSTDGDDEEGWYAKCLYGSSLLISNKVEEGIKVLQSCFDERPWRLEPLNIIKTFSMNNENQKLPERDYPTEDKIGIRPHLYKKII